MNEGPYQPAVLVVDDSVVVRKILVMTIHQLPEFLSATVDEAGNGAIALKMMGTKRYDLVISDIRMPFIDGLELVRRVRDDLQDRVTPIVLVSTLGTEADIKNGLAVGATAYVIKPLSPHHIKLALRKIMENGPEAFPRLNLRRV
jgi:two-component system, chemotaxis family, chemotaxis protein CheY